MAVLVDERLQGGERVVQRLPVEAVEHDGGQGPLVLRRQRHVGTGHCDGSWHAQLPVSHARGPDGSLRRTRSTSLRDYLSTVTTAL
ncbi:hypothetical protein TUSST3_47020 [Streptomyces sp. TUS-ST3]|nr:hypothetical protein TUSST3_47020 [Streptomyces sp. TUS-ST3]